MDLGVAGRTYVVTGGTSGLGRATAEALAAEGANVVVSGRSQDRLDEVTSAIGSRAAGLALDNADPAAARALLGHAMHAFGRADGLLVSVGGPPPGPVSAVDDDQWRSAFDSVFLGAVRLARTFAEHLAGRDGGAIAFVLSSSVRSPLPRLAISNGLRPGLAMVAKDLADEFGPQGVRVFSLLPGRILTDRTVQLERGDAEARARSEAAIPLRRLGRPEEFGRTAAMLLSPAASYLTGCVVPVDGGLIRTI